MLIETLRERAVTLLERTRQHRRRLTAMPAGISGLLVATAGDRASAGALRVAAALARRDHSRVAVVTAVAPVPYDSALHNAEAKDAVYGESCRRTVAAVKDRLRGIPGASRWMVESVVGWPEDILNDIARSLGATLILMGLRHHGAYDRLFGLETTIVVARKARVPVLAVNPRATGLAHRVLAATAFDDASFAAAVAAARVTSAQGTIILAHAAELIKAEYHGELADIYRAGVTARLHEVAERLRRVTGRRIEPQAITGDPVHALLEHARRAHCDLIALGGSNHGWVDRLLLGSVRSGLPRAAACSILVAPAMVVR